MYLLDYSRTMNQIFNGNKQVIDKDGIMLGVTNSDVAYATNKKGTIVAFVQERDLWLYNKNTDELSQVFSFANMEGQDERSRNDQHAVRIIQMDNKGNITFAVYGYMNRGEYEGQVGVAVYYFDDNKMPYRKRHLFRVQKSFAIAEDELGKMVYFNEGQQMLYVLAGGTLYQVSMEDYEQTKLAEDLDEGQYVVSEDGHLIAYEKDGSVNTATEVEVLNLANGKSYTVEANEGEAVRPLGFVAGDFYCRKNT